MTSHRQEYDKNHPKSIKNLFGSIATQYDRANGVLSWQMHRTWNKQLVQKVIEVKPPEILLDLCCGTGDITFTYLSRLKPDSKQPKQIYLLDFCQEMLDCASLKSQNSNLAQFNLSFLQADAHKIPLPSESVDCVTLAYGIRNLRDALICIQEVHRVLRPGGHFGILELTRPDNKVLRLGHQLYLKTLLPWLGKLVTSNEDAYQYLCQSIQEFIHPAELEKLLIQTGFQHTWRKSLTQGIATLFSAQKI